MIKFNCPNCSAKLKVPDERAGQRGTCPRCAQTILVPASQAVADLLTPVPDPEPPQNPLEKKPYKLTFLDNPKTDAPPAETPEPPDEFDTAFPYTQAPLLGSIRRDEQPPPQRKLPWIIDIFLFPLSPLSLGILVLCMIVPIIVRILMLASGPFILLTFFPGWIIIILLYVYAFWYFSESIRQSAEGQLRAPSSAVDAPGFWDILLHLFRAIVCFLCFFFPMIFYLGRTQTFDTVFWLLFAFGIFMFPMGLLAVNVLESLAGINPVLILAAAFHTILPYSCIVAIFFAIGWLSTLIGSFWTEARELFYISIGGIYYLLLVAGHLLGRFYFKYQEKLSWDA